MRANPFFISLVLHQVEIPESDNRSQPIVQKTSKSDG